MNLSNHIKVYLLITFALLTANVWAEEGDIEKVQVTGSHIRRIDTQGAQGLTVLGRKDLEESGYSSLGDVMRDLSFSSFGVPRYSSLSHGGSPVRVSFRGLPGGYVLFLLNGKRVSANINHIPMSAIERVEISTDGASSIYGSDAIGGVINFITKSKDIGFSVSVSHSYPQATEFNLKESQKDIIPELEKLNRSTPGGDDSSANLTYGWSKDRFSGVVNATLRRVTGVWHKNRPFSFVSSGPLKEGETYTDRGFSPFGYPGTYILSLQDEGSTTIQNTFAIEGCPTVDVSPPNQVQKSSDCKLAPSNYSLFSRDILYGGLFGNARWDITDNATLDFTALYSIEPANGFLAPAPDRLRLSNKFFKKDKDGETIIPEAWSASIPELRNDNPNYKGLDQFLHRIVYTKDGKVALRGTDSLEQVAVLRSSLDYFLDDNWRWNTDVNLQTGSASNVSKNFFDKKTLIALAYQGKWNPFDQVKEDIESAKVIDEDTGEEISAMYDPHNSTFVMSAGFSSQLDGELFSFRHGTLSTAVGVEVDVEGFSSSRDDISQAGRQWGGGSQATGFGSRGFGAAFAELALIGDLFEISASTRSSQYVLLTEAEGSVLDFSALTKSKNWLFSPLSPKLSIKFKPFVDWAALNFTVGTGFRAPGLGAIYSSTEAHPFGKDIYYCQVTGASVDKCPAAQLEAHQSGNRDLQPEKSLFMNTGLKLQPTDNLFLSVEYFFNELSNRIDGPNPTVLTRLEYLASDQSVQASLNDASLSAAERDKAKLNQKEAQEILKSMKYKSKRAPDNTLESMDISYYNSSLYRATGLDLRADFSQTLYNMTFFSKISSTVFLEIQKKALEKLTGSEEVNRLGTWGFPRWKSNLVLGLKHNPSSVVASLSVSGLGNYDSATPASENTDICSTIGYKGGEKAVERDTATSSLSRKHCIQTPSHFQVNLTLSAPMNWSEWFGSGGRGSLVFNIENLLGEYPPYNLNHTVPFHQSNDAGIDSNGGAIPNGFYASNGRVWKLQYQHQF